MRKINFFDGVTTGTPPTIGNIVASDLVTYANDAAYEAGEAGSPVAGNVYFNTTSNLIRYYNGTSWISLVDVSSAQTLTSKSISGSTNTLTNLDGDNVIVDAVSGLTATNAQAAFAEHQGDIDSLVALSGVSGGSNDLGTFTGTTIPDSSTNKQAFQALETSVEAKIPSSEKGAINGVATLDGTGKIPSAQMPLSVMDLLGNWNASTNSPTLADGVGNQGDVYRISVAGTQDLGSGPFTYQVGDWVYYNGSIWEKGDNIDQVTSVASKTGAVTLVAADITDFDTEVSNNTSVAANTAKVSADGSIDTHSDVDTSTVAPTDTQVLTWVAANSKWEPKDASGGSGQGGINYITNYDAEVDTTGWATYKDTAGTSPVDGTGGSPTITWTRTTWGPLRGAGSFLLTKIAGSQQGEGASSAFSIDEADKAKVLTVSFDYKVGSGTFTAGSQSADSDVTIWVYDVTNSVLIQPSSYKLLSNSSTITDKFSATFQSASDSTSYRLIIHVGSSSGLAYQLYFDNFNVGPSTYVYGTPITDWQSYTPTGSWSTNTTYTGLKKKEGDVGKYQVKVALGGAPTSATLTINMPSGETIDTSKLANITGSARIGTAAIEDYLFGYYTAGEVYYNSTSSVIVSFGYNNVFSGTTHTRARGDVTQASPITFASGDVIDIKFEVPILGWSSSVQTSDQTDTRVVAAIITGNPASASSGNPIIVPTVIKDTHGAYNATTGRYTVIVPGFYKMFGALSSASSATTLSIYKDASVYQLCGNLDSNGEATFAGMVECVAGSVIDIRPGGTVDATDMSLNIERVSGPNQIAASESVNGRYYNSSSSVSGSFGTVTYTTKDFDSHGTYASGIVTVPISGKWTFNAKVFLNHASVTTGNYCGIRLYKNNATNVSDNYWTWSTTAPTGQDLLISDTIQLLAGDTIRVQVISTGTTPSIGSSDTRNYISYSRVGN